MKGNCHFWFLEKTGDNLLDSSDGKTKWPKFVKVDLGTNHPRRNKSGFFVPHSTISSNRIVDLTSNNYVLYR